MSPGLAWSRCSFGRWAAWLTTSDIASPMILGSPPCLMSEGLNSRCACRSLRL